MGKQLSWATIIIIVILSICVGIGGGILLSKKMENSKIVKDAQIKNAKAQDDNPLYIVKPISVNPIAVEVDETESEETINEENNNNNPIEIPEPTRIPRNEENQYTLDPLPIEKAGEGKTIQIDGEKYTITWKEEILKSVSENNQDVIVLKLYLNNKKIRSLCFYQFEDVSEKYEIRLHNVNGYIVVEIEHYTPSSDEIELLVFNTEGEHIDDLHWSSLTGIYEIATDKTLTYEINDNNIILNQANGYGVRKYKYTFNLDMMFEELLHIYDDDEVELAGK